MKTKFIILVYILSLGYSVYADAIINRNYSARSSSIQSSSIVRSNLDSVNLDNVSLNAAISELERKIKNNSDDYSLYVSLSELYIRNKQYEKSFDELDFLNNLEKKDKLDNSVKSDVYKLLEKLKRMQKYSYDKSSIYLNMALLSSILDNKKDVEMYLNTAASNISDINLLKKSLNSLADSFDNYGQIISICDRILYQNPNDVEVKKLRASYYLLSNNNDAAISDFIDVIKLKPEDDETKYTLYKLLANKNLAPKDIIKRIYNLETYKTEDAYNDLAQILLKNEQVQDAKPYAEFLVNKFPDNAEGYILLSDIYRKEGKLKESYEALNKVRDKADNNEAISKYNVLLAKLSDQPLREANSLIDNGLYKQAIEVLENSDQDSLYVLLTNAKASLLLNDKQKTLEYLNKAMSLYPDNSEVYCSFAYVFLKDKDIESARTYINKSIKLDSNNQVAYAVLEMIDKAESEKYLNKGILAYENQNYNEAMNLINEAIDIYDGNPALYYNKGLIYIAQNNYAASTACFYKCIELDVDYILAYFYLGLAFDNLSEPKNALLYYEKFIKLFSNDEYGESEKLDYANIRIKKIQG